MSAARRPTIGSTRWYDGQRARPTPAFHRARMTAYGTGQFVGQDGFLTADEIRVLAQAVGAGPGARVLDACCGSGGPAVYVARETGCRLVGVDLSRRGVEGARDLARAGGLVHRAAFVVGDAVRLPLAAGFDAVLLLETMLAIEDEVGLVAEVARLLAHGGCFGLTLEEGTPHAACVRCVR